MIPLVIGLTGGIGSGKSTVAKVFSTCGIPVYNSDSAAKRAYYNDRIKENVLKLLGVSSYLKSGELNRKYVSELIFSNEKLRTQLNDLIHPYVAKDFDEWCASKFKFPFVVKETALLFETGMYKNVFKRVLVTAPEAIKIERVMTRDGVEKSEVEMRMKAQMGDEKKIPQADFVINNNGEELIVPELIKWIDSLTLK